jgi:hypothetical protein
VWRPANFGEIETAIGMIAESPDLDFKRDLSKPRDIAKDIASMSLQGGVIAYGIDEQPETGLATALTPIELDKVPERIQQIVDTAIWPTLSVEIEVFRRQTADTHGVVLVRVASSPLAPHYTNERFPARSDRTTRYLTEREIGALYEQRRRLLSLNEHAEILDDFIYPLGAPPPGVGFGGIGMLRLLLAPVAPSQHPAGVRLARPLEAAVAEASRSTAALRIPGGSVAFDLMKAWRPRGAIGWEAGETFDEFPRLNQVRTSAGVCEYGLTLSLFATMSLVRDGNAGRSAFEHLWAAEVVALLLIAGHLFAQVPSSAIVRAELGLQGFDNAVANAVLDGYGVHSDHPRAPDGYAERTRTSARELVGDPIAVARRLLDRFFIAFVPEPSDPFLLLESNP